MGRGLSGQMLMGLSAVKRLPSSARCILLPPLPPLPQLHLEAARISLVERAHIFAV